MNDIFSPMQLIRRPTTRALLPVMVLLLVPAIKAFAESPEDARLDLGYCLVCHGYSLEGNAAIQAPALAGIERWYLETRLEAYRQGTRGHDATDPAGAEMLAVAREIAAEQVNSIAAYVATFPVVSSSPVEPLDGDVAEARAAYAQYCAVCHGATGEGNELLGAPSLTRLNPWYVVTSYAKYSNGLRGQHEQDTAALQMRLAVQQIVPEDFPIESVANFLATLSPQTSGGNL